VAVKVMGVSKAGGVTGTVTLAEAHSAGKGGAGDVADPWEYEAWLLQQRHCPV
jgi:hypothetical protein